MKNKLTASLLLISAGISFSSNAAIPVVDLTSIAKVVEESAKRAEEAKRQFDQFKQEAELQKRRFEGVTDWSSGFDTASAYMKDGLKAVSNASKENVGGYRDEYRLKSDDPDTQAKYDAVLQKISFYDSYNTAIKNRADRITQIQKAAQDAATPAQKEDLANQLRVEQMTLDMQLKQYELGERRIRAEELARKEKIRTEVINKLLKQEK